MLPSLFSIPFPSCSTQKLVALSGKPSLSVLPVASSPGEKKTHRLTHPVLGTAHLPSQSACHFPLGVALIPEGQSWGILPWDNLGSEEVEPMLKPLSSESLPLEPQEPAQEMSGRTLSRGPVSLGQP